MAKRVWWLCEPRDDRFASGIRTGTWETIDGKDVRVSPLVIEWEKGPDLVGDFLWPSFQDDVAMKKHVFGELQQRFGGIEGGPVEITPPKWRRKKKRISDESCMTIWNEDLQLVDVRFVHHVDVDWDKSCIKTIQQDGETLYEVYGGERTEVIMDLDVGRFATRRVARFKGGGIFVKARLLDGHSFFKVNQFPVWNLCTDAARDFILDRGYTNIDFFEVGELF
jgi:hypothetical protein